MLGATFDGASVNRRLVKLHDTSEKIVYRVRNIRASDGRYLFFFSDPPHLIKTTRNCWASKSRTLWVSVYIYIVFLGVWLLTGAYHNSIERWKPHFMATFGVTLRAR